MLAASFNMFKGLERCLKYYQGMF